MPLCSIPAVVHHHDQVGERHGLVLAVSDVDKRDAEFFLQTLQLGAHPYAQERVERGERFVEKQDLRIGDQRAGEGDALLLAPGKLGGQALSELRHVDEREHLRRLGLPFGFAGAAHLQAERHIAEHGEVREQRVGLEHHRSAPACGRQVGDVGIAEQNVAGGDDLVPGDHAQRGTLAATGRAEQAAIIRSRHLEIDRVDGDRIAIALGHGNKFETGGLHRITSLNPRWTWVQDVMVRRLLHRLDARGCGPT